MNKLVQYDPILITGAERSGATFIARILDMCGVQSGRCNGMFENTQIITFNRQYLRQYLFGFPTIDVIRIPAHWREVIEKVLTTENMLETPWMVKSATLARMWPVWNRYYPDAKWLIVRRRTGDVIQSCIKTGYMGEFKDPYNVRFVGGTKEEDGWLWWIHQYENKFVEMVQAGLNHKIIWPDRMVSGDYQQIQEMVEWLGLKWNERIPEVINPLLKKSKEVIHENNS